MSTVLIQQVREDTMIEIGASLVVCPRLKVIVGSLYFLKTNHLHNFFIFDSIAADRFRNILWRF
jgi:hypothetical protein